MGLLELPVQVLYAILTFYLSFTSMLADGIQHLVDGTEPAAAVAEDVSTQSVAVAEHTVTTPASEYVFGGPIPKILIENTSYQEAQVAGSEAPPEESEDQTTTVPDRTKHALVNIYCQYKTEEHIRTTTGSGFFISQNGVVLTNAHVAQFLLLDDAVPSIQEAGCILRTGDPAVPMYTAELLYISPAWINQNAKLITSAMPRGTGERDYALLYVSGTVGAGELPATFPYIAADTSLLSRYTKGADVLTAGYPGEAIFTEGADAELRPLVANTIVSELYTFGSNYADVFSLMDSEIGQHGASGGPVVTLDGNVIGLVVTKGDIETEGAHSLRAITLSYIDRTILEETGFSLADNMRDDLAFRSNVFKTALAPFLTRLLALHFDE